MTDETLPLLLQPDELARMLDDPLLRILDATVFLVPGENGYRAESGLADYRREHLPGAVFMDLIRGFSDPSSGLGFTLPEPATLAAAFGALGVSERHRVVVYSSGHLMWATRAFWLLRHLGHERVSVLDGGLAGWRAAGHAPETGDARHPVCEFVAKPRPELFVGLDEMQRAGGQPGVCTVNTLSPEVYAGTGPLHYGRRGHIPGSINLHYEDLVDAGRLRSPDQLRATLRARGLLDADRVITYCGGGIAATSDAFTLRRLGAREVSVYDGSLVEWSKDASLPMQTG